MKASGFDYANAQSDDLVVHMMSHFVEHEDFDRITPEAHKVVLDLIVALTCAVDNSERGWKPVTDNFAVPVAVPETANPFHAFCRNRYEKLKSDLNWANQQVRSADLAGAKARRFRTTAKRQLAKFFVENVGMFVYHGSK